MMHDPVVTSALTVMALALGSTLIALFVLYLQMQKPKKNRALPASPNRRSEVPLAIFIGVLVPAGVFLYALYFSPYATQTPDAMHQVTTEHHADHDAQLKMGKSLFSVHCASCHGPDGNAPNGKGANLTRRISFESALLNIQRGANNFKRAFPGGMPPMISDTMRAAQVAHYVSSGFTENEEGRMLFEKLHCARCHGEDGRGKQFLGPNIRDFDLHTVAMVLKHGKNGVIGKMPKFERFTPEQVEALGTYVIRLSP